MRALQESDSLYAQCEASLGEDASSQDFLRCYSSQLAHVGTVGSPVTDEFARELLLVFA